MLFSKLKTQRIKTQQFTPCSILNQLKAEYNSALSAKNWENAERLNAQILQIQSQNLQRSKRQLDSILNKQHVNNIKRVIIK